MWFIRTVSAIVFLLSIVFTIPLAFDVGGRTCGLAFSLSISTYYFFYSLLKVSTPDGSRFRRGLVWTVAALQVVVIPSLLIWSLNKFSVDADNDSGWVERTFGGKRAPFESIRDWLFGREGLLETIAVGGWDKLLRWSTPVFQLSEGFCSLLVIQAAGQVSKYLVNQDGGDAWMIGLLLASASTISTSVYFLWRITTFPDIDNVDAVLIGIAITCAFFLCVWGIGSGRGNPAESSLLFAYITLCLYQIFTDYQPSSGKVPVPPSEPNFPPLPPIIMASYSTLMHAVSSLPSTILTAFNFLVAVTMTITPSVIISLAYRILALYGAARIIPAIRESGARGLSQELSLDDSDGVSQVTAFLSYFSPSILIAVYTSLLMQHFATSAADHPGEWWTSQGGDAGSNVWRWANLAGTMALYAVELYLGKGHDDSVLTSHWKVD